MCASEPVVASTFADILQVTRHQGGVESLFHESMATKGLIVQRPVVPTDIELSEVESDLRNPNAYPVKVPILAFCLAADTNTCAETDVRLR